MQRKTQTPNNVRLRRTRTDIREPLLESGRVRGKGLRRRVDEASLPYANASKLACSCREPAADESRALDKGVREQPQSPAARSV
jgi:hypothetical protein